MISYSQNFEDVILWRALKHVQNGFYIDVGAQDPVEESVSLAFYEKGWRGIHVEPNAAYADRLRKHRPDETVIQAAVGPGTPDLEFFIVPETGLSTGAPSIAAQYINAGRTVIKQSVPTVTLSSILDQYREKDVHWLKIDVEGMELDVIESWLPSTVKPWIVVVEATLPNSDVPNYEKWEPLLTGMGYNFVYFDGLNRFYLKEDKSELASSFGPGPNWFD